MHGVPNDAAAFAKEEADKHDLILKFSKNWALAHAALFRHRHTDATPMFHYEIIDAWHSALSKVLTKAFRGGAKSTLAEEVAVLMGAYGLFHNGLVIGSSNPRAIERLRAIKHEYETNEYLIYLFGGLVGPTWNEDKIVLSNGVCFQAVGRGQSLRGIKHLIYRPDFVFGDDMEDEESTASVEAIDKFKAWFMGVVLPALDPRARVRVLGTPLAPGAFVEVLSTMTGWTVQKYPAEYIDKVTGARTAMWAERYPVTRLDQIKQELAEAGTPHIYAQEYLMEPEDPTKKAFKEQYFTVVPTVRTYHPVLAMFDPARTVNERTSATTGHVVGSWVSRSKLVLWEADGRFLLPNQIIDEIFRVESEYHPALLGVEEDGLNEFIKEPLRQEQLRRQIVVPVKAMKAPQGKTQFIRALQPFFESHAIEFAREMPTLRAQLLGFPTGRIDAPNALAYFLRMRPGMTMYDNFGNMHVAEELIRSGRAPMYLAVNATGQYTTAVLCQFDNGVLKVFADWVREGDPGSVLSSMIQQAGLEAETTVRVLAPERHWRTIDNIGLVPAAARVPVRLIHGGPETVGREEIRKLMRLTIREWPAVRVSTSAHWTLNGFTSGYARHVEKNGVVSEFAEDGIYKILFEGLEAFAGLLQASANQDMDGGANFAYTSSGVRYMTALPQASYGTQDQKAETPSARRR